MFIAIDSRRHLSVPFVYMHTYEMDIFSGGGGGVRYSIFRIRTRRKEYQIFVCVLVQSSDYIK